MINKYYEILGVTENASKQEIDEAYRKRLIIYHPDKYEVSDEKTKKEMAEKLEEVKDAYDKVTNKKNSNTNNQSTNFTGFNDFTDIFSSYFNQSGSFFNGGGFVNNCVRFSNEIAFDEFQKFYQQKQKEVEKANLDFSYINQLMKNLNSFIDANNRGKIDSIIIKDYQDKLDEVVKKVIENAKAFDKFQTIFANFEEKFVKFKLKPVVSLDKYLKEENRGKTTASEFKTFQEETETAIKNTIAYYNLKQAYETIQENGINITIDEKYLDVKNKCQIDAKEFQKVQQEMEKEFNSKIYQLQKYNELIVQLDITQSIFIHHGKSLDEPKEYLDSKSINQFRKYVEDHKETINFDNMNFIERKLNNEIRTLIEERREKYISEIYKLDKKHSLNKMLGTDFKMDYMTNGQLELSIKSLSEFMTNANFLQRKTQLFVFAVALKKQLDEYREKVLKISAEIEELCRSKNIMVSLLLPSPYKLDYLSYEELETIQDNLLKWFSVEQKVSAEMNEGPSNSRTA